MHSASLGRGAPSLLAIFPFLIFTSSLTAVIGDRLTADALIEFLIAIVPPALVGGQRSLRAFGPYRRTWAD